jgi:2-polyprenyl-6-methoxyphenol hydroxylase-like FAD-dependent oxidoreductase
MPGPYRVGVVGFGVGGATTSLLLARAGHEVDLFERAPRVGPIGAGVLLQPSGQMVLRRLGLYDQITKLGEPIEELHALNHRGRTIMRMPYTAAQLDCRAFGMHRGDIFEALHAAVEAEPVRIHLDHEILGYRIAEDKVWIRDRYEREHGPFDFLIAADGARSTLRGQSQLRKWIYEYEYGVLWAFGRCDAVQRKLHQAVRGTHYLLGLLPMGNGRCSLFWSQRKDEKERTFDRGFDAWKREVISLCPLAEQIFETVADFSPVVFTTYQHVWMPRWHNRHVLFLGDAAHAMSPHLGQGINLALIDAYLFADSLARSGDFRRAFQHYVKRRRAHLRFYSWVTLAVSPFFQSRGIVKGILRDIGLPILCRLPFVRGQMALTMAGLKRSYLGGCLDLDA